MSKKILQSESRKERLEILKTNAERSELFTYPKNLSPEEMEIVKSNIVKSNIELAKLKEEKDAFNEIWKVKKKPVDQALKENLQIARTHVQEVEETVYLMADQDEGVMEYYNEAGVRVFVRPLNRDERQMRIVDTSSTGTDY